MSPLWRRLVFPLLAILPPTLIALATEDVGILVTIKSIYYLSMIKLSLRQQHQRHGVWPFANIKSKSTSPKQTTKNENILANLYRHLLMISMTTTSDAI